MKSFTELRRRSLRGSEACVLDSVLGAGEEHSCTPHYIPLSPFPVCPFEDHLQTQELHKQPVTTAALLPQPLSWQHRGAHLKEMNTPLVFNLKWMKSWMKTNLYKPVNPAF